MCMSHAKANVFDYVQSPQEKMATAFGIGKIMAAQHSLAVEERTGLSVVWTTPAE